MGCTNSDTSPPHPSPSTNTTPPSLKPTLIKLLQSDNLPSLITVLSQQNIPLTTQLSDTENGKKWMMIHYCCRYDAYNCLEYLLRRYFVEFGQGYLEYVNAGTGDGDTCLHLCGVWKGEKAFGVLCYYGGLNLGALDKDKRTPMDLAYQYRCKEMSRVLAQYRDLSIHFTRVQCQRLTNPKLISQDLQQSKPILFSQPQPLPNPQQIPPSHAHLLQQQKDLQSKIQQLLQKKLQKQSEIQAQKQKLLNKKDLKPVEKQQNDQELAKLQEKLREERGRMREEMEGLERELGTVRDGVRKGEVGVVEEQRMRVRVEIQNYLKNNQALIQQIKRQQNETTANPSQTKPQTSFQPIAARPQKPIQQKKNIRSALADTFNQKNEPLPPEIEKLYKKAQQNGIFVDEEFQASNKSIGDKSNPNFANFKSTIEWLRPKEIFGDEEFQLFNGIQASDVQQGELGVCYMLATISSLATNPVYIQNMFVFSDIQLGFYVIKLYINGIPKYFTIDDQIPCDKSTNYPVFTQPVGNELWVMLMQKVWAKAIGSYLSAEGMVPDQMMEDLSGAPGFGGFLADDEEGGMTVAQHIQILVEHSQAGSTIVLSSNQKEVKGIVPGHAYSLMQCFKNGDKNIFKIRNPWGNFQWQGQYSEKSKKLTPAIKTLIGYTNEDDGVFFMSQPQLLRVFGYYSISVLAESHKYSHKQFQSKQNQDKFFKFTLSQQAYTNVRIIQKFNRMLNDPSYKYSPGIIEIGKIEPDGSVTFIDEGDDDTYGGAKSIHAMKSVGEDLGPGEYFVRVRMIWGNQKKYNTAVLAVYAIEEVKIEELDYKTGLEYLKKLFYSHATQLQSSPTQDNSGTYKIDTMKGQFVLIAQTQNSPKYSVQFQFTQKELVGARLEIGKSGKNKIVVDVDQNHPGVGSIAIVSPQDGGSTGEFGVVFVEK